MNTGRDWMKSCVPRTVQGITDFIEQSLGIKFFLRSDRYTSTKASSIFIKIVFQQTELDQNCVFVTVRTKESQKEFVLNEWMADEEFESTLEMIVDYIILLKMVA